MERLQPGFFGIPGQRYVECASGVLDRLREFRPEKGAREQGDDEQNEDSRKGEFGDGEIGRENREGHCQNDDVQCRRTHHRCERRFESRAAIVDALGNRCRAIDANAEGRAHRNA